MAVMYPYSLYANALRRDSEQSHFSENDQKYRLCVCHVKSTILVLNALTLCFCLLCVAGTVVGLCVEHSHEYLNSQQINQQYRESPQTFDLFYRITLIVLLAGSFAHCLTVVLCMLGVRWLRPAMLVPELVVGGLFFGLVLFATISIAIVMITFLGFSVMFTVTLAVLLLYASLYSYALLLAFRFVRDKRRFLSSSSKSDFSRIR